MAAVVISVAFRGVEAVAQIEFPISNCNTVIEVIFEDLFEQEGIRVIAVNEFFDSKLGRPVSDKSIHGIFLQKCFGGYQQPFDRQVDEQLRDVEALEVEKVEGKSKCYPIGTTALGRPSIKTVMSHSRSPQTNPQTCKAYSDVTLMWDGLA